MRVKGKNDYKLTLSQNKYCHSDNSLLKGALMMVGSYFLLHDGKVKVCGEYIGLSFIYNHEIFFAKFSL